jgi:hypothetical protein
MVKHVTIHSSDRVTPTTTVSVLLSIAAGTTGPQ